jgi:multidrug resistance efflux pump
MARQFGLIEKALSFVMIFAIVALAFWSIPTRLISSAQEREQANNHPLIARGYTDATMGTVTVAGDARGGQKVIELRIKEGQQVKRGDIIAVLGNYPGADIAVRMAETNLEKVKMNREAMLSGPPVTQIAMAEADIKTTIDQNKLWSLERTRSGMQADAKALANDINERALASQKSRLKLQKQALQNSIAQNEIDIAVAEISLENARADREAALVRSPIDGEVVEISTRQGELISWRYGIAKIVDIRQLRVRAEVDELHLPRLLPGARVEIAFRGNRRVYEGRIVRAPLMVTRFKRSTADLGIAGAHTVEVEIEFVNPSSAPQILDGEVRVTFL